ncbi:MAG TPA: methyltransferase domain-containing protein [Vicinamibacterales bacterium]|nr:methyltransferase domain-containing protein [Vicinamibacterales bacterium]
MTVSDDPSAGSRWSAADTVAGFSQSPPNATLIQFAAQAMPAGGGRLLDIGCGAGRNAVPIAQLGWEVLGLDLSMPMLRAAAARTRVEQLSGCVRLALARMDALPVADRCVDFVVAHGIWNLARSAAEFRAAVREAARVARPGAALFVFTFSRNTLPPHVQPVGGEPFVFTEFSGEPQVFLTAEQLGLEMHAAGFAPDTAAPLQEHNLPRPGTLRTGKVPVIYEALFRRVP